MSAQHLSHHLASQVRVEALLFAAQAVHMRCMPPNVPSESGSSTSVNFSVEAASLHITQQVSVDADGNRVINVHLSETSSSVRPPATTASPTPTSTSEGHQPRSPTISTCSPPGSRYVLNSDEPELPEKVAALAHKLFPGSGLSPLQRIRRAWTLGLAAGRFLDGRQATQAKAQPISLRNNVYIILRAPGCETPCWTRRFSTFQKIAGQPLDPATCCHGFPSQAEAAAFAIGAGFPGLPQEA
jgi:hypothetical protein